jgi:hypothetical protein
MRWFIATAVIVAFTACASSQPRGATTVASPLRLDSLTVSQIAPDAFRVDQLILADTAVAMAFRDEPCPTIDRALAGWANGAEAFNVGVRLGASLARTGGAARSLHPIGEAGFIVAGAAAALLVLNELDQQPRDFGTAKIAVGVAAAFKLLDAVFWKPAVDDSRAISDAGMKLAEIQPAVAELPTHILALRTRCATAGFDRRIAQLRAHQLGLVNDFITVVDRVPSRHTARDLVLMSFRQRARIYQMQVEAASR